MPAILSLRQLRREGGEFKARLHYIAGHCLKPNQIKPEGKRIKAASCFLPRDCRRLGGGDCLQGPPFPQGRKGQARRPVVAPGPILLTSSRLTRVNFQSICGKDWVSDLNECFSTTTEAQNFPLSLLALIFLLWNRLSLSPFPVADTGSFQVQGWVSPIRESLTVFIPAWDDPS